MNIKNLEMFGSLLIFMKIIIVLLYARDVIKTFVWQYFKRKVQQLFSCSSQISHPISGKIWFQPG